MNSLYTILLLLILPANTQEIKSPVVDEDFCNKKLEEYKQKVPNIITAYQKFIKDYPECN